jgi:L-ascorbate metabolism protein UlaG (beta-lactamase superfamily)
VSHNVPLYLKPNVQLEPLVDHWYAWSYLIPPATAARNMTERHLKIMDSYINAPQVHAAAVKNPKMLGGPFIDYGGKRVDEIRALRDRTVKARPHLMQLSAAIGELDAMLRANAKGFSLQPLYPMVPDALRGYVELVYDLNNNPSFRLIEPLLYRSPFYDESAQSMMLSLTRGDDRPFVLSTPRLESADALHLRRPFRHECVDQLFALKYEPQPFDRIKEMLDWPEDKDEVVRSFLTPTPPPPYQRYEGDGVRWRYFGHACILIETKNVSLMFDPVLSYTYESSVSRYTYLDLPNPIDYVLITHNHQDHVLFETLLQLRHRIKNIIVPRAGSGSLQDPSIKQLLQACGFTNVIELEDLQTIGITNGEVTALPFFGEHADLDVRTKLAYMVRLNGHSLLFAADSCNIEPRLYEHVRRDVGDADALFLGMECQGAPLTWLYGPLLTKTPERAMDESRRLAGSDYEQGIDIVNRFNCKHVYVYAMGQEPWLTFMSSLKYTDESKPIVDSNRLLDECRSRGIVAERLFGEREILLESRYALHA